MSRRDAGERQLNKEIELHPAYSWDCEDCGRENFERAIVVELSEADKESLKEEHGIEQPAQGDFLMMPETVECWNCGSQFETVHQDANGEN